MAKTVLERAHTLLVHKKYYEVITLLEPCIIQYNESFTYFYYLGLACLYSGDFGGATSYLQRARKIKMRDPDLLVALAALFLRRMETNQAVEYYLEALEYNHKHTLAKKALSFIRIKGDAETIAALFETNRITKFYPKLKRPLKTKIVFTVFCGFLLVTLFVGVTVMKFFFITAHTQRADLSHLALVSRDALIAHDGGSYRYILTEKQIQDSYAKAQAYFHAYNDNAAQVEINRILLSNASSGIKQKSQLLMTYLAKPSFNTIKQPYMYQQVFADPSLYQDCWVQWRGMATNLISNDNYVSFDFLVGYDSRTKLEGIVPVQFNSFVTFELDKPLEILAQVRIKSNKIVLEADSFYQSLVPIP